MPDAWLSRAEISSGSSYIDALSILPEEYF